MQLPISKSIFVTEVLLLMYLIGNEAASYRRTTSLFYLYFYAFYACCTFHFARTHMRK